MRVSKLETALNQLSVCQARLDKIRERQAQDRDNNDKNGAEDKDKLYRVSQNLVMSQSLVLTARIHRW